MILFHHDFQSVRFSEPGEPRKLQLKPQFFSKVFKKTSFLILYLP